jgi:hypothetical protein
MLGPLGWEVNELGEGSPGLNLQLQHQVRDEA